MTQKGSRRQRATREGTFLESVKKLLEKVAAEVDGIKTDMSELKHAISSQRVFYPDDYGSTQWGDQMTWGALNFEFGGFVHEGHDPPRLDADVAPWEPLHPVYDKYTLLSLQGVCPDRVQVREPLSASASAKHLAAWEKTGAKSLRADAPEFHCNAQLEPQTTDRLVGDFRSLPKAVWQDLYKPFKALREPNLLGEYMLTAASPPAQHVATVTDDMANPNGVSNDNENSGIGTDSESGLDLSPMDSDEDATFWEAAPCSAHGWYVNLVPARYRWEPTAGVGECEWHELVQTLAIRVREKCTEFSSERFPIVAARRLLAILSVQNLQQAWATDGFGAVFANRFEHPAIVSKGIDAIAESVHATFENTKRLFIEKDIVHELLA